MQANAPSSSWYRSTRGLSMAVTLLLAAQIALLMARAFGYIARIRLLHRLASGEIVTRTQGRLADSQVAGSSGLWLLVFIATGVVWLVWQHRAEAIAQHLATRKLTFSPGWAVGWWFVPVASLVQPFRAVRELWQTSGGPDSPEEGTWPVLVLWWAGWLGFNLLSLLGRTNANTVTALTSADERELIAVVFGITSAVLAIAIVRSVVRRQESSRLWLEQPPRISLPPPPPPLDR
jgi:Domain of unknown function (DUF4328)